MNCLSVNILSLSLSGRRKTENNFGISWAVHHRCEVLMGDYLSDRFWPKSAGRCQSGFDALRTFTPSTDLDVGLVYALAAADQTFVFASHFLDHQKEADRPPVYHRMVDRHAALFPNLLKVPVAQRISGVSTDACKDHVDRKAHTFEVEHVDSSWIWTPQFTRTACPCSLMRKNPGQCLSM